MEERSEHRRFSRDEVGELIETATRLDQLSSEGQGLSEDELRRIALELGISQDSLEHALAERRRKDEAERATARDAAEARRIEARAAERRSTQRRKAINEWKAHATSYFGVIGGLAAIDLFSGDGFDWFFYPAAGWGIGFLIHSLNVLFRVED